MMSKITIVTPAYNAHALLPVAVRSVLAQDFDDWQHLIVSDDGTDYEATLRAADLLDRRQVFISTPIPRSGGTTARNMAFDQVQTDYITLLDADDFFAPAKLSKVMKALEVHAIVATGLQVTSATYESLRTVGGGPDRFLTAGQHKFSSISMDSMISWDRRRTGDEARYDTDGVSGMTDLDLLMQLFRLVPGSFYLAEPLHGYVKVSTSMSNGDGFTARMIASKNLLIDRLRSGYYPMPADAEPQGLERFLRISLRAEELYPTALSADPSLLFETHLEGVIAAETALS